MPKRVLIVDDDLAIAELLRMFLEPEGFQTEIAGNGVAATQLLYKNHFDLVITDLFMPEKDGLEFLRELRLRNEKVKIIAVSGGGSKMGPEVFLKMAQLQGASRTFEKPFDCNEIVRAVKALLAE